MNYWHELVKSYDNVDVKGSNRYIYSESTAVIILMLLVFGKDYAYNIAELLDRTPLPDKLYRGSVLKNPGKLAVILNKMKEDCLIISDVVRLRGSRGAIFYRINPRIIQSPWISPYYGADGTIIEFPIDMVESFLSWIEFLGQKEEMLYEGMLEIEKFDYLYFMNVIKNLALEWEESPVFQIEFPSRPKLSRFIEKYVSIMVKPVVKTLPEMIEVFLEMLEERGLPKYEGTIIIKNGKVKVKPKKEQTSTDISEII